jgi:hypothetical protein
MEDFGVFGGAAAALPASATIISIVENRAREVCLSRINLDTGFHVELYLLQDNHAFTETLALIDGISPNQILLHDGCRGRVLSKKIEETNAKRNEDEACRGMQYTEVDNTCRISYISRTYYDQNLGAEFLKRVIIGDIDGDLIAKYTVLAGVYCLLRYIENCTGTSYAAHSLRLEYCSSSSGRLNIDRKTALSLELIINRYSLTLIHLLTHSLLLTY